MKPHLRLGLDLLQGKRRADPPFAENRIAKGRVPATEEAAEKYIKPCPQGLKPIEGQALNVGAKAPTPGAKHFFRND
jgi:hypothetical protein